MKAKSELSSLLSGVAGEYFVAAELSRRGYIASITLRNTRGVDILVSNADATKSVGIQVKTNQGSEASWVLNKKIEDPIEGDLAKNLYFVFVRLNEFGMPAYHVVSREEVARFCRDSHRRWLDTPGRKGREHKDNPMRVFRDPKNDYLDDWKSLNL